MILHGDLDAFYAGVAQRDDASLRGKPLVVAGASRRAVVLTASYEARPFGILSAMPLYQAKSRCPELVVVPPDFAKYRQASQALFAILHEHASAVEGLSLDEAFCELGDATVAEALDAGRKIKDAVKEAVALSISIGIASGKMVAKIASDDAKPDGLRAVAPGTEAEYLKDKPIRRLWGIGPKTEERVRAKGLERIGQIAELSDDVLYELFGRWGAELRDLARGIDHRGVNDSEAVRSISSEETFEHDVAGIAGLLPFVRSQADQLAERLKQRMLRASTVAVKIKLSDRTIIGRQTSLAQPTDDPRIINAAARFCLRRAALHRPVRLIGVRVASLAPAGARQIALFS
ncbi:MAG: DNA polymerase IV [Candidatus Eremiobacter antarcticus]|nr:MAG: DNA polymerase IV [Candidatus Eremiobacter sp. RRmetagenome_bin22]